MYTIQINHKEAGLTKYKIYSEDEAVEKGISYKYWKEAKIGDYATSDDGHVAKLLNRREYKNTSGKINIYLRFPWGYTFFNPRAKTKPLKAACRKTNTTMTGKSYIEVQSRQRTMKDLALRYALEPDYDKAIDWVFGHKGTVEDWERRKWKRTMKSEVFRNMVKDELANLLKDKGLTEEYTLELLENTIKLAKDKKDVTNLMRAVDNLQDMHGMKEKNQIKTTEKLEAHSTIELLDELKKEEKSIQIEQTTTKQED